MGGSGGYNTSDWNKETQGYSDWERSSTRMLFFADFVQLIQRVPYKWSSCRVWRLKNRQV